jgi:hypothetical protein
VSVVHPGKFYVAVMIYMCTVEGGSIRQYQSMSGGASLTTSAFIKIRPSALNSLAGGDQELRLGVP